MTQEEKELLLNRVMSDKGLIKKEIERLHELLPVMDGDNVSINYAERICIALEKYIDSLPEEPASEDLEEEIEIYSNNIHFPICYSDYKRFARHFAEWQKQQMMRDAVVAEVMYPASSSTLQVRYRLPKDTTLKYGDRVKIIIIRGEN